MQDSLVRSLSARMAVADSSHDTLAAVSARLDLAPLLRTPQAVRLVQDAAALADSAGVAGALSLRAHRSLVDMYTAMGEMTKANREWEQVHQLTEQVLQREASVALEQAHGVNTHVSAQRDSLSSVLVTERAKTTARERRMQAISDRWKLIAFGASGLVGVLLLLGAWSYVRRIKRLRNELEEMKKEVAWLRMVKRSAVEPKPVARMPVVPLAPVIPPVVRPEPSAPAPATAVVSEEEAMLLALVRRRGAERLNTLRDARQRGDLDKVVRVVHSLKPQLVSLDAEYYSALCARLVAAEAVASGSWNADLDALERGMHRLLASA